MKTLNAVLKALTALAAVAGTVYVVATYGDKIVAWAKQLWSKMPQCPACEKDEEPAAEEAAEVAAEEAPAEEPAVEEAEEEPAVEVTIEIAADENEPVAEEADFEA